MRWALPCDKWDESINFLISSNRLALAQSHGINRSPVNWVVMSRLESELTQCHFYHDLLASENYKGSPDSCGGEIDSSILWKSQEGAVLWTFCDQLTKVIVACDLSQSIASH